MEAKLHSYFRLKNATVLEYINLERDLRMVERLKSWESPRKRGRNYKGKGGSARARQLRKREKMLLKKLKKQEVKQAQNQNNQNSREERESTPSFFMAKNFLLFEKN